MTCSIFSKYSSVRLTTIFLSTSLLLLALGGSHYYIRSGSLPWNSRPLPDYARTDIVTPIPNEIFDRYLDIETLGAINRHYAFSLATQLLVVRSVHFDPRQNATVFLVEVARRLLDERLLCYCQVGRKASSSLRVHTLGRTLVNHTAARVECLGLPRGAPGDSAFLYYKLFQNDSELFAAKSERTFGTSWPFEAKRTRLVACVSVISRESPPAALDSAFAAWIDHLKALGVDHIHAIVHHSFINRGGFTQKRLLRNVARQYLSVDVWTEWTAEASSGWGPARVLGYNDCALRYLHVFDYMLVIQWGTFLIPESNSVNSNSSLTSLTRSNITVTPSNATLTSSKPLNLSLTPLTQLYHGSACKFRVFPLCHSAGRNYNNITEIFIASRARNVLGEKKQEEKRKEEEEKRKEEESVFLYRLSQLHSVGDEGRGEVGRMGGGEEKVSGEGGGIITSNSTHFVHIRISSDAVCKSTTKGSHS